MLYRKRLVFPIGIGLLVSLLSSSSPALHAATSFIAITDSHTQLPLTQPIFKNELLASVKSRVATLKTLVNFDFTNGAFPTASLIQGKDGFLYGTTSMGGTPPSQNGTVFRISPNGLNFKLLASFEGSTRSPGRNPYAPVLQANDNVLYGTTRSGGKSDAGLIFRILPSGKGLRYIFSFKGTNGSSPGGGLIQGTDGYLYGTTEGGGSLNLGTVFRIAIDGSQFKSLFKFKGSNGRFPKSTLVQGTEGYLYGTTSMGGILDQGTVFRIKPDGSGFKTLVHFGATDGSQPLAGLIQASDSNYYGTTGDTVFRMTPSGLLTTLYSFALHGGHDGSNLVGGVIEGKDGNFYGTTSWAGAKGKGTIFRLTPTGQLTTLVNFNGPNGDSPFASLIQATNGSFYGTTYYGGSGSSISCDVGFCGTVFRLNVL